MGTNVVVDVVDVELEQVSKLNKSFYKLDPDCLLKMFMDLTENIF